MRDWPMFQTSAGTRRKADGRAPPPISELIMEHVPGSPSEKLVWLREQQSAGKLDGDDREEIAQAEALLAMLVRMSAGTKERRHLDDLLDAGLKETFPASDPVSVGHFTSTEAPSQPVDGSVTARPKRTRSRGRRVA